MLVIAVRCFLWTYWLLSSNDYNSLFWFLSLWLLSLFCNYIVHDTDVTIHLKKNSLQVLPSNKWRLSLAVTRGFHSKFNQNKSWYWKFVIMIWTFYCFQELLDVCFPFIQDFGLLMSIFSFLNKMIRMFFVEVNIFSCFYCKQVRIFNSIMNFSKV